MGPDVVAALFQAADLPLASTTPAAALVQGKGGLQLCLALELAGQIELQSRQATGQPGVVRALFVEQLGHLACRRALIQCLAAAVQMPVALDVLPAVKTPGVV